MHVQTKRRTIYWLKLEPLAARSYYPCFGDIRDAWIGRNRPAERLHFASTLRCIITHESNRNQRLSNACTPLRAAIDITVQQLDSRAPLLSHRLNLSSPLFEGILRQFRPDKDRVSRNYSRGQRTSAIIADVKLPHRGIDRKCGRMLRWASLQHEGLDQTS